MIKFKSRFNRTPDSVVEISAADAPVVIEDVVVVQDETDGGEVAETPVDIHAMTKKELDDYALTLGISLDRRATKARMVEEFLFLINNTNSQ
jgi:hypothetical protein